jgi:ABC-type sugar transport system substrate-binding protein
MKRLSCTLLIISLIIGLFALTGLAEEITIGYVGNLAADSNVAAYGGMVDYAERMGWKVELIDLENDITKTSPSMINYVSMGVDAIVVCCSEAAIIEEGVAAATEAGIPVFLADTENIGATIVNGTTNCWAMGALLGSQVVDRIRSMHGKEGGNVAIIGTWDGIGWGISRAILDSGMTKDNIFTMSIDGSDQTYDLIRRGDPFVGVIAQNFAGWSEVDGDAIQAIVVEGKDLAEVVPQSKTVYVPYKWIDITNVPAEGESVEFDYEGLF